MTRPRGHWRRTAWGRASNRRRSLMILLIGLAIAGFVVGSTVWRPAAIAGPAALVVLAFVTLGA